MAPLTIAYVGNFSFPFCTEVHVAASLEALGHRVVRLQENRTRWQTVPATIERERAQVLLWTRTWAVDRPACLAALERVRSMGVPSAFYHLDRWWGLDREYQVREEPFFRMDLVFSPDGGSDDRWAEAGVNHRWLPPGVFGPECGIGRIDRQRWPHDVVFVGSHPYPHGEWEPVRSALIAAMEKRFGDRFHVWTHKGLNGRPVRGQDLADLYASSKVVVGDSCLVGSPVRYWSDRIPETLGRGGALVHPWVEGLDDWYEHGRDLVTYPAGDPDAAVRAVEHLLEDDKGREAMRSRGQSLVMGRDTYEHRMATVLDILATDLGIPEPPAPPPPVVEAIHARSRARARFQLAQGDTDATAVREVWHSDDYKLTPEQVRRKVVVDIGANVGAFSVLAARMGAARVIAYEPHPDNARALRANVEANRVAVEVTEQAVVGAGYAFPVNRKSWHIVGDGGGARVTDQGGTPVTVVQIDEVVAMAGSVGLLKIDCEGGEYEIVGGAWSEKPEWLSQVERIVMEFHGPGMPHLADALEDPGPGDEGRHEYQRWGAMVARLADYGRVETFGHPRVGGLLWWSRY